MTENIHASTSGRSSVVKIGNISLENALILAPMAGITDLSYRQLCKEQGCSMVVTEMVSAKAILYRNQHTKELLEIREEERPAAVQLFGSDPDILGEVGAQISEGNNDCIDLNMGCPVPKIVNNGEGSALMREPKKVEAILASLVKNCKKPVTVKIRKGFSETSVNAVEIAKIAESCGVAAITVHGRTREQYYSGKADWEIIRQVKENVKIPVIGNGDVFTPYDAERMLRETGCDGVMIARGAKGNPWIFSRIKHYLKSGELLPAPSLSEIQEMAFRHGRLLVEYKGEKIAMREMRKHMAWYTAGLPHSAALRNEINKVETLEEMEELFSMLKNRGK